MLYDQRMFIKKRFPWFLNMSISLSVQLSTHRWWWCADTVFPFVQLPFISGNSCSVDSEGDAEHIYALSSRLNLTGTGYAWIVTEQALRPPNVPMGTFTIMMYQQDK